MVSNLFLISIFLLVYHHFQLVGLRIPYHWTSLFIIQSLSLPTSPALDSTFALMRVLSIKSFILDDSQLCYCTLSSSSNFFTLFYPPTSLFIQPSEP
ncbi:hypothetical protein M426DRAFT_88900 [Hypoxylon sp. CI-4A]|nr:hypothetical protein M426DRAFT_88900 [Hypoxylon sp. CI-4A]